MAEFTEVMKQKERMCEKYNKYNCVYCPLEDFVQINCDAEINANPQEAEKIIMNWAKEHPVKTNADKFKEVFGFEPCTDLCVLEKGVRCKECEYKGATEDGTCCSKWWEEEYKEPKEV